MEKDKIKIVILAAGKGKRMQSDRPKSILPVKGKPMLRHLLESIRKFHPEKPFAVIGHGSEEIKKEMGDWCCYVLQDKQLGTGHAVSCAKEDCSGAEHILVLSGDQPFTSSETMQKMVEKHLSAGAKITFTIAELPDFSGWRKAFIPFGRILRKNGNAVGIREYKDLSEEEKNIKEVNAGCYVFDAEWLWKNLGKIKNENAQGEYYLTDLLQIASENGDKVEMVKIDPREALGANTKEELEILEKFAK